MSGSTPSSDTTAHLARTRFTLVRQLERHDAETVKIDAIAHEAECFLSIPKWNALDLASINRSPNYLEKIDGRCLRLFVTRSNASGFRN